MTIGLALLVVAVVLGIIGSGVLGLGRGMGGPVTLAANKLPGAVLPAKVDPSAPILGAGIQGGPVTENGHEVKQMPKHVLDWLKHLERTERRKVDLCGQQLGEAGIMKKFMDIGGIHPGDFNDPEAALDKMPGEKEAATTEGLGEKWVTLITFFDSVPPPTECVPIRNSYSQHIQEVKAYMGQIHRIMQEIGTDMGDTEKMKAKLDECRKMLATDGSAIDAAGKSTDDLVQQICDEYGVKKWFNVRGDVGEGLGPMLGGMMGH